MGLVLNFDFDFENKKGKVLSDFESEFFFFWWILLEVWWGRTKEEDSYRVTLGKGLFI